MKHDPSRLRRLLALPRSARTLQRDVDDEIRFHIDSRVTELVAAGLDAETARAQAMAEYGDLKASRAELTRVDRDRLSRQRWTSTLDAVRSDVAYGFRTLRKQPGYTAAVIVVLALGIGANATMFGVIDRLLLHPPAQIGAPARLMTINYVRNIERDSSVQDYLSFPIYMDARSAQNVFASVAAYAPTGLAVGLGAEARSLRGMKVSTNFFSTLQVRPAAGRFFRPEEEGTPPAPNVAVISYGYWKAGFNGDTAVIGQSLPLGQRKFTIVGVAPRSFRGVGQSPVDVWIPITEGVSSTEYSQWLKERQAYWLMAVGRLRPGVSREQATTVATQILRAAERRDGASEKRMTERQPRIGLQSILPREALAADPDAKVAVLLGAVSLLVLLIACANVTNLQLARALRRRREVAVRLALGVARRRLIGQLIIESLLLSLAGGAVAIAVARFGGILVRRVLFTSFDWDGSVADPRLLAYTAAAAIAAGVLSGILPALHASSLDLSASLKEGAREGRVHRTRTRAALLVLQTTLSVLLLVGTGLFTRSLERVRSLPLGMEPDRVLLGSVRTTGINYTDAERLAMYRRLLQHTASVPGIESAALATSVPFSFSWGTQVSIPGRDSVPTVKDGGPYFIGVTSAYLKTMGMRLLRGRGIEESDLANTHRIVVVNESIARLWWPGGDAIGRCMKIGGDTMPCTEVVGVVTNPRRQSLIEDASLQFFLPIDQTPPWVDTRVIVIRPSGSAAAAAEPLRRQLQVAEPGLPYLLLQPLAELVNPETRSWRLGSTMFAAFGALALVLAAVGLYSMLTYDVGQRGHELGVRVALGARAPDVTRTVMDGGVRLVAVGITTGIVLTLAGGRFIQPLLFQTSAREPLVLASAAVALAAVALLSMLVPTWRATRVDPIVALRAD